MQLLPTVQRSLIACAALLCTTSAVTAQPGSLIDAIPAESNMSLIVRDFPALEKKFQASPMGSAWKSPEMNTSREFFDTKYAEAQASLEAKLGINLTRLISHIKGDVIIYNTALNPSTSDQGLSDLVFAFQIDSNDVDAIRNDIAAAIEKMEETQEIDKSEYDFQGVSVRRLAFEVVEEVFDYDWETGEEVVEKVSRAESLEYGFLNSQSVFFMATGPEGVSKSLINTATNPEAEKLSSTTYMKNYLGVVEFEADVFGYVNLPKFITELKAIAIEEDPENQVMWDFMDAAGFSTLEGFGVQLSAIDQGLAMEYALLVPRERKGLIAALYPENYVTLSSAKFAPKNALSFKAFQLDLGRIWDAVDRILIEQQPETKAQLDQGVAFANMQMQTNIVNNLIKNIGGEHAYYQVRDPKGVEKAAELSAEYGFTMPEQLNTGVSIATLNSELFNASMTTMFEVMSGDNMGMPITKSEFNGLPLWGPDPAKSANVTALTFPTFGLAPKHFLISTDEADAKSLARLATGAEQESLSDSKDFQMVTAPYSKEFLAYLDYSSPENLPFVMKQLEPFMAETDMEELDTMIPESEWFKKYFGPVVGVTYTKPEAIYTQGIFYMVNE
ncbi:MAG: hypothetical protein ACFCU1_06360 [Sumerlaeia bacterium]